MKLVKVGVYLLSALFTTACATGNFVGQAAVDFQDFSCFIEEEICGLSWQNDSFIAYTVEETEPQNYQITGKVEYNPSTRGIRDFVSFYILFMDENGVIAEKRVKTYGSARDIDFSISTDKPVTMTTVHSLKLWVRT